MDHPLSEHRSVVLELATGKTLASIHRSMQKYDTDSGKGREHDKLRKWAR